MFCTKCGNKLIEGAKFCQRCGAPAAVLPSVPPTLAPEPAPEPESVPEFRKEAPVRPAPAPEPRPAARREAPVRPAPAPEPRPTVRREAPARPAPTPESAPQKKSHLGLIIAILVVVAIAIGSIPLWFLLRNSFGDRNEALQEAEEAAKNAAEEEPSEESEDDIADIVETPAEEALPTEEAASEPDGTADPIEECAAQYLETVDALEAENPPGENGGLTWSLIYFDGDKIPELISEVQGNYISMYTYDMEKNETVTVMDHYVYGAMGNAGYEYIPRQNLMRNQNSDYAGMIYYFSYSRMNENHEISDYLTLREDFFKDIDGDLVPDNEKETYEEKPVRFSEGDQHEISEEEFIARTPHGLYLPILGEFPAEGIREQLSSMKEGDLPPGPHGYRFVISDVTWDQAFEECLESGGHLVTFESDEEFWEVHEGLKIENLSGISLYVGGKRDDNGKEYFWVDADGNYFGDAINSDANMHYWLENEPSFSDGGVDETRVDMIYRSKKETWYFNDIPNDILALSDSFRGKIGYICEYE